MVPSNAAPGTRQARGRERREAILDAAIGLFATSGFRGTTVAAVADRAGMSDAGLLYHFPTKEHLLLAVLVRNDERRGRVIREYLKAGGLSALRALRDFGVEMERTPEITSLHVVLSGEHLLDDSPVNRYFRQRYARVTAGLARCVEEGKARGEIRDDVDPLAEARALLAVTDGCRLQWFFSDGTVSMADTIRTHIDQMVERVRS